MAAFNAEQAARQDIRFWIDRASGLLPPDLVELLRVVHEGRGSTHLTTISSALHGLQAHKLSPDQLTARVVEARDWSWKATTEAAHKVGRLQDLDPADPALADLDAPGAFLKSFAGSLQRHVTEFVPKAIREGRLVPGGTPQSTPLASSGPSPHAATPHPTDARAATIAAWQRQPTFSIKGTVFTQRHAAELAAEFDRVGLTDLERLLGRASAPITNGGNGLTGERGYSRSPTLEEAMRYARRELPKLQFGPPDAQVDGAVVKQSDWFAVPQRLVDEVKARHPVFRDSRYADRLEKALAEFAWHVSRVATSGNQRSRNTLLAEVDKLDVGTLYGRGLQQQGEELLVRYLDQIGAEATKAESARHEQEDARKPRQPATSGWLSTDVPF